MDQEVTGLWGVQPSQGSWTDPNATFEGITAGLVAQTYDLTYGPCWMWIWGRTFWFDFTPGVITHKLTLAFNFKEPRIDLTLLLRPFTVHSWIFVLLSVVAVSFLLIFVKSKTSADGMASRIVVATGWLLFILTNAYFGGALTMFFSSEASLPFLSLEEGAEAFPTWTFLHKYGSDLVLLDYHKSDGTVGLPKLLNRVLKNSEKFIVNSEIDGLNRMSREKWTFMYTSTFPLVEAMNHGYYEDLELKLFGEKQKLITQYMLAKNSPYKQMLTEGSRLMLESGLVDIIMLKWRGKISHASQDGLKALGGRHMALVFLAFALVYVVCLVILLCECLTQRLERRSIKVLYSRCLDLLYYCMAKVLSIGQRLARSTADFLNNL